MAVKAIIFDMDGVIVDTEYIDFQVQSAFIKQEGGTQDRESLFSLVGKSYELLYQTMRELIGTDCTLDELEERYKAYVGDFYKRIDYTQYFRKDILAILDYADKEGIPSAVASSSTKKHIYDVLRQCGIVDRFICISSGEDMVESKPNPAIYTHTLQTLGVPAHMAVAVEDSSTGIMSAKGAGLSVIAYREERLRIDQSKADYIGRDMPEIFSIIKDLHER